MKTPNTKEYHIDCIKGSLESCSLWENRKQSSGDKSGGDSYSLMLNHQSLASHYYLAYRDIEKFRYHVLEAAKLAHSLIKRTNAGEPITCRLNAWDFNQVSNALAGCDFSLAKELSSSFWESKKINEKDFRAKQMGCGCITFGLLMNDDAIIKEWLPKAYELSQKSGFTSYAPHPFTVEGIWKKDVAMINKGLESFAELHTRFVKTDPDPYENFICIRGIGLANLALHRGLSITIPDSEFFPKDLIYQKK